MASTGAVFHVRPRTAASVVANHQSGAKFYLSPRFVSGLYSTTGVTASSDLRGRKSWMPHRAQRWFNADGTPTDEMFNFMNYLANTMVGGPSGPTLPDVATTVTTAQEQAATASATVVGVNQMAQQNAESLAAAIQVVQDNSLAGAAQIPRPQLTSQMTR